MMKPQLRLISCTNKHNNVFKSRRLPGHYQSLMRSKQNRNRPNCPFFKGKDQYSYQQDYKRFNFLPILGLSCFSLLASYNQTIETKGISLIPIEQAGRLPSKKAIDAFIEQIISLNSKQCPIIVYTDTDLLEPLFLEKVNTNNLNMTIKFKVLDVLDMNTFGFYPESDYERCSNLDFFIKIIQERHTDNDIVVIASSPKTIELLQSLRP